MAFFKNQAAILMPGYLEPSANLVAASAAANLASGVNPCGGLAGQSSARTGETPASVYSEQLLRREAGGGWDAPGQHHVVGVVFPPLPLFAGVHGEVQRQHLVLGVGERDHHCWQRRGRVSWGGEEEPRHLCSASTPAPRLNPPPRLLSCYNLLSDGALALAAPPGDHQQTETL